MIAVDWGTSRLRAYRLDAAGTILEQRRSDDGATACRGRHAETLRACIDDWDEELVLLCGMVGSRHGWQEVPYVACPAGIDALAAALCGGEAARLPARRLWLVPGMADRRSAHPGDTMRGEESQVLALLERLGGGRHAICLPGTHSKWVAADDGRIASIATAMTGELFDLLRRHGTLAELAPTGTGHNGIGTATAETEAFDRGLRDSAAGGGLLHHLFGARAQVLFEGLLPQHLASYLSGLLIGHEVRSLLPACAPAAGAPLHLVGNEGLLDAYARAFAALGVDTRRHSEQLAADGLYLLARRRGLA
ncbi:2-dehydro-3-deoxygalactonokinase [Luteimonas sp. SJ-92]|uniref:2-dehydro-3-deoxygalactonokinase n=1 Tax=Luteimonas salinisoli TaxID=2752307 RepID=A0A853JJF4_9GAMM|nr:2-dehydro-3-deoxygalactonokinase [Luteimonas salinisoli]NZA28647.1 2-dehydro-3-deoxygalactonokinase [Luteimonas salinisoli]